ncbi:hypothetical protein ACFLSQ_06050 [Bacteroidota bacterium]
MGFLNFLMTIVRNEIKQNINDNDFVEGYFDFEQRIDKALIITYELYLEMKMKLEKIKIDEVKRRNEKMMERIIRKYDGEDE